MISALVIASHPPLEEEVKHILATVRIKVHDPSCYGHFLSGSETCDQCHKCIPCAASIGNPRVGVVIYDGEVRLAIHLKGRASVKLEGGT
jgi:predicted aldo/keto reductase-like oxidoreductase